MPKRPNRNLLAGGFFALTIVLATASVAYGCVQTIGVLSVTGPGTSGTSTAVGSGNHPPFGMYCVPPTNAATAPRATSFNDRPSVTITYGPSTTLCPTITNRTGPDGRPWPDRPNTPVDGTYEVNFCDGKVFARKGKEWDFKVYPLDAGSCFFNDSPVDRGVIMGQMTVTGGSGTASLRIPAFASTNGPNNAAGIAVRRSCCGSNPHMGPPDVNLVPISII